MNRLFEILVKTLFALAAASSALAGLWIALAPQTIHTITAVQEGTDPATAVEFTTQVSWYQVQGWWGIAILIIFAALYSLPAYFLWRGRFVAVGVFAVLALLLTFLAGFSIGGIYLPAAIALLLGLFLLVISRFIPKVDSIST